jgi:hypothetical protein
MNAIEIKFRAKYEPTGEWHYFNLIDLFDLKDSLRYSHWSRYIGLKDEDGTEIYEGDIITNGLLTDIVVWKEKGAMFGLAGTKHRVFISSLGSFKVIGNIFDNPELKSR